MAGATPKLRAFVSVGLRLSGRDANGGAEAAVCCWPGRMNISASDLWRLCFGERRRRRRRGRGGGEGREDREEEAVEGEIASLRLRVRPLPSHARLHQTSRLGFSRNNFTNIFFFFFPPQVNPALLLSLVAFSALVENTNLLFPLRRWDVGWRRPDICQVEKGFSWFKAQTALVLPFSPSPHLASHRAPRHQFSLLNRLCPLAFFHITHPDN